MCLLSSQLPEIKKMEMTADQVETVPLARQNRARQMLESLQRSQHIKQGYSFAKRAIIVIALILFIISACTGLLKAILHPSSGSANSTTHDLLVDIDRRLNTALQFLQIAAGVGAVQIGSVVEEKNVTYSDE